jgi:hypothetical protein
MLQLQHNKLLCILGKLMGLHGDIKEIRKAWPELPAPFRLFLAINFFISCLSVASLADSIYALKGFVKNAINIYHEFLSPVLEFIISNFGMEVSQTKADSMLLVTLIAMSLIRSNYLGKGLFYETGVYISLWIANIDLIYNGPDEKVYLSYFYWFGMIFLQSILPILFQKLKNVPFLISAQMAAVQILITFFTVAVLAAISEGLYRA